MLHKRKAKELVKKMYKHQWREGAVEWEAAKNCAIIVEREVIKALNIISLLEPGTKDFGQSEHEIVIEEIKKL